MNEKLFAFDVHIASKPDRAGAVYTRLEENLCGHARTLARHTCGISSWNLLFVRLCCGQQKLSTLMLACGGDLGCPPTNRAFASSVGHPDFVRTHLQDVQ